MKFDSEWLLSLLEGAPTPDAVATALTDCGFLVELREPGDGAEIWDVEVTTNRPDAMNHRGLAREAAVATGTSLKELAASRARLVRRWFSSSSITCGDSNTESFGRRSASSRYSDIT